MIFITHAQDNVGIVTEVSGLQPAFSVSPDLQARELVPFGQKISLQDMHKGQPVIRYGQVIGYLTEDLEAGRWLQQTHIDLPEAPTLDSIAWKKTDLPELDPLAGYTFEGYRNRDGSVGTKNVLAITTSVQCVAGVTEYVVDRIKKDLLPGYTNVDDVVGLTHQYGCGVAINAPAAIVPIRTVKNLALNPNFGGEVMVLGLGCEKLRPERLVPQKQGGNGESDILYLQDESLDGFDGMVTEILAMAERHLEKLNSRKRETCPASDLVVGMQCGGSDVFSGITGNPVAGFASDLIVRAGGTVMFSEVTEVRDAAHLLIPRCRSEKVANRLKEELRWYDDYLIGGQADRSANPSPGNKRGGLSNVVEKALGSVVKSGSSPIVDVIAPGERVQKKGLNFVATPASDFVCGTLQVAAGMNMHVFITGRGTPYGLSMVPVIKVSSNTPLKERWHDLVDLDAGRVITGEHTIESLGWELFELILDVASGHKKVACDKLGIHNDLALFNPGPLT